jgi:uncharacterized phiE125 gp8 family phage protein
VLKTVTAATVEPVTLADAKLFLRVDTDADDTLISALISAAREYAEHYTQTTLASAVYELALDAFPQDAIELPNAQTAAVESVKYTDTARDEQTLDPAAYVFSDYGMTPFIYPLEQWPQTAAVRNAVRIRYAVEPSGVVGTGSAAARAAILEMVAHLFENREDAATVPPCVLRLLDVVKVYR